MDDPLRSGRSRDTVLRGIRCCRGTSQPLFSSQCPGRFAVESHCYRKRLQLCAFRTPYLAHREAREPPAGVSWAHLGMGCGDNLAAGPRPWAMRNLRTSNLPTTSMPWTITVPTALATWLAVSSAISTPVSGATDTNVRKIPPLNSFYLDDGSCAQHSGEKTQTVNWNGRRWNVTAPESLVSPPYETKRNGTPLEVTPLSEFVVQAQKLGATLVNDDRAIAADNPVALRLVMVVHDLLVEGPAKFSLDTIIAVRLCGSSGNISGSALYIGPREGRYITEWWRSNKSQRWIDEYRHSFSLSVADALEWAMREVNGTQPKSVQ